MDIKNDLAFSKRRLKIANSFKDELWQNPTFELKTLLEPLTASTMQLGLELGWHSAIRDKAPFRMDILSPVLHS